MTIVEVIEKVLKDYPNGLTCKEITDIILSNNLYIFNAKDPSVIVNHELRKHCEGLTFSTAHPVKYYRIVPNVNVAKKTIYQLLSESSTDTLNESMANKERVDTELLPEEQIERFANLHFSSIQVKLLEAILNNPPEFFEQLVIELLVKLGYGYNEDAGKVVGKSHDGGIDGIINEDALGLDKIYVQAKRYSPSNSVGRPEIQSFAGAMMAGGIKKGVFITSSSFTATAKSFAYKQSEKYISLIDGELLTELMIKNGVGIRELKCFVVYDIDTNYFSLD